MGVSPQPIHLLHVDDEPDMAEMAAEFLQRADDRISVDAVTSASKGLDQLEENGYDCVVSDFDMPGQSGIEFLEAVREEFPDLPFILYTGKGSEEVASEAIAAGVSDYLQKESGTSQYEVLANRIRNVVEKHRSEEEIAEREYRTHRLLEHSSDYLFVIDESGKISYISPSVERVLGYDPDEMKGENAFDFTYPKDIETATEALAETLERPGEEVTAEFRAKHADGGYRWLQVRGRNLLDDPVIEGILVNARDITERKEREQEVVQLKEEFETVFNNAQDALFLFDVIETESEYEFKLRRLNPAHEAITGLSSDDLRGATPREILGEEQGAEVAANLRECVEAEEPVSYEEVLEMPSGTLDLRTKLAPVIKAGEVVQVVGAARDITDRKERERELERYEAYLEDSGDIITVFDENGTVKYESPAVTRILGYEQGELVGEIGFDYIHPDDQEAVFESFTDLLSEPDQTVTAEYRFQTADGRWCWLEARGTNQLDTDSINGVITRNRDITARKEREQELQRQNERLEEFASVVSHDLRNPLSVADGRLNLAIEERDWAELDTVAQALDRMEALIDDMLSLANAGEDVGETTTIELAALVESCWQNVETESTSFRIETEASIRADKSRLQQLIENLLRNAVEHGGAEVAVTVGDLPDGFYVEDDGPGIPEEVRAEVLEPGYSSSEAGTGFGLSIVRDIAHAHGWKLRIADGEEGGARFEFTGVETV